MAESTNESKRRVWRAGRSSLGVHLSSIFSLAVAFVCLAASLVVVTNIALVRDRWEHAGRATVYLRDGASLDEVAQIQGALRATGGVRDVRSVSAEDARREVLAEDGDVRLAALPASAFPASLEVSFEEHVDPAALVDIATKLRALPPVEAVETYESWTERFSSLLAGGVAASGLLTLVVLAAVVSVVGSTMRLLLQRRRIEVEVLKLVGATNGFVRRPFVIEAAAQGALGALTALGLVGVMFLIVRAHFDQELATMLGITPSFLAWYVSLGVVTLGGALGALTALVSLRNLGRV